MKLKTVALVLAIMTSTLVAQESAFDKVLMVNGQINMGQVTVVDVD